MIFRRIRYFNILNKLTFSAPKIDSGGLSVSIDGDRQLTVFDNFR